MNGNAVIQSFRRKKIFQLSLFIFLLVFFFLIILIVKDLRMLVFSNPAVTFLTGFAILGFLLGILVCAYDLSQFKQMATLNQEWKHLAYYDKTGIPNRYSLDLLFDSYNTEKSLENVGCCLFTIKNLEEINQKAGRKAGDELIHSFCSILDKSGAKYGYVGRNGGNEFVMVLDNCSKATMTLIYTAIDKRLYQYNEQHPQLPIKIRRAYTLNANEKCSSLFGLLAATYTKLQ